MLTRLHCYETQMICIRFAFVIAENVIQNLYMYASNKIGLLMESTKAWQTHVMGNESQTPWRLNQETAVIREKYSEKDDLLIA